MRPGEIDHSNVVEHYIDVSNGEILAGSAAAEAYRLNAKDAVDIRSLGETLRQPSCQIEQFNLEKLDTSDWPRERHVEYGRWLRHILSPPDSGKKWITRETIENGHNLGIGPSDRTLTREFGKITVFFASLKLAQGEVDVRGVLDHLTIDDYVDYLKRAGKGRAPTLPQLTELARRDPLNPSVRHMEVKYPHLKLSGLLRLAGFMGGLAVIRSWDKDDYLAWGIRFMHENEGTLPTALAADYFSKLQRGPTSSAIANNFDSIPAYQKEVAVAYWQEVDEKRQDNLEKLSELKRCLEEAIIPSELISPDSTSESAVSVIDNLLSAQYENEVQLRQVKTRYAKFRVLEKVVPGMTTERKVAIATDDRAKGRKFVTAITKHYKVPESEIEYAALIDDSFDDIWKLEENLPSLQLGEGYQKYYRARHTRELDLRKERRKKRQGMVAPA